MKGLISIIIPTYNRRKYIGETIESLKLQTYKNWECIVIDDGSEDSTDELMDEITKREKRIRYYKRPENYKKGPAGCRNYGFTLAKGEYINWFDSDDIMLNNKLESDLNQINSGNYDFTINQTQFFDTDSNEKMGYWNDKLISEDALNDFIMLHIGWSTNAPLWRKSALLQSQLMFNEDLFGPDDFDYHINALIHKLRPVVSLDVKVLNRVHPDRIENHSYKAKSKSIIVYHVLKRRKSINLSQKCIDHQVKFAMYLLKNMYKNKRTQDGFKFSKQLLSLEMNDFQSFNIWGLYLLGLFYAKFGKGYNLVSTY